MPFADQTNEFRDIFHEKQSKVSDVHRRDMRKVPHDPTLAEQAAEGKDYNNNAHVILNHIDTLTRMLMTIRKPYLNVDTRTVPSMRHSSQVINLSDSETSSISNIRHLTDEERDQIDAQARIILSRCADRVREMETLEKRRVELIASKTHTLSRFIPARLRQSNSSAQADFRAAHNASITWYLNRRLAEASQAQKDMQEERIKRQLERTKTLGSGAAREATTMGGLESSRIQETASGGIASSWLGDASSNIIAATIGATSLQNRRTPQPAVPSHQPPSQSDDEDEEIELTASQIMQFETENATILQALQTTLGSIQQAESSLLEISALQTELTTHLTRQTELTEQLYEDAIAASASVEKGNVQLREAKRRAKDGRLFILVFLMGASLSLLFLHYY